MITSEVAKRIWKQLGEGWLWVESADAAGLDEVVRQLDERRRAALESLVECEELHAIVSAERAARRYDDAEDPLAGAAEWYKASTKCIDDIDEHFEKMRETVKGLGAKMFSQLSDESEKARRSFVKLRKENEADRILSAIVEAKERKERGE